MGIEPQTSFHRERFNNGFPTNAPCVVSFTISLLINTLTVIPKTTHQAKCLKKNTNVEKYIALVNVETWLAVVDKYLDATV